MSMYVCDIHEIASTSPHCTACELQEKMQELEIKLRQQAKDIEFVNARKERIKDIKETKSALERIIEFYEARLKAGSTHESAFESTKNQINVIDSMINDLEKKV